MGTKPTGFAPFSIAARCHEETHASQQLAGAVESLPLVSTDGVGPIPDTPAHPTRRLPLVACPRISWSIFSGAVRPSSSRAGSQQTPAWREVDSNPRFPARGARV